MIMIMIILSLTSRYRCSQVPPNTLRDAPKIDEDAELELARVAALPALTDMPVVALVNPIGVRGGVPKVVAPALALSG